MLKMETLTVLLPAETQITHRFRTPIQATTPQARTNHTTQEMPPTQLTASTESATASMEAPPAPMEDLTALQAARETLPTQAPTAPQAIPATQILCRHSPFPQVIRLLKKAPHKKNNVAAVKSIARNALARYITKKVKSSRDLITTMVQNSRKTC